MSTRTLEFGTACLLLLPIAILAAPPDRIGPIDPHHTVVLTGNRSPKADPKFDQGLVDASFKLSDITLMLRRSPAQQAAIEQFLKEQQDPSSPEYHRWLTPEQYADRFGLSAHDVSLITAWLQGEGFKVEPSRGRQFVVFSGTAAQIQSTFRCEIHRYQVNGTMHFANAGDPSIPAALRTVVLGIRGLDDFYPKRSARRQTAKPRANGTDGAHYLVPGDVATIYDITPLQSLGFTGTGQKVVIIGTTDVDLSDLAYFREFFGLPANVPQLILAGADPGTISGDLDEANLDLDWVSGIAPDATIYYVAAQSSWTAVQYAIDQNIAPVIGMSYGYCEPQISSDPSSSATFDQQLAQQANTQGTTWITASGDGGAAECDEGSPSAQYGYAVQLPASIPEVTGVGGTEFNEGSGAYWSANPSANYSSALSYIPEVGWNDTTISGEISASGGGASIFFSKPSWQTGPGVPADNARDVPDISMAASADHDGYETSLTAAPSFIAQGGTSAAAQVFAGIIVLLNQYLVQGGYQAQAGVGNINPKLYSLAQGSSSPFHDITGGSNIVPCTVGTTNCTTGEIGFNAGPGYDQVTGLGSVDVNKLITGWVASSTVGTTTTVSANPTTIASTGTTVLTATVTAASGSAYPTGNVTFAAAANTLGTASLSGSGTAATASISVSGGAFASGGNTVTASYAGNSSFGPSSGTTTVTVTTTSHVAITCVPNPVYQSAPDSDGYLWFYTITLTETSGVPTTITSFSIAGTDYSSSIASFFGSNALPANGSLSAPLRSRDLTPPASQIFAAGGQDAGGATWATQISVPFLGPASSTITVTGGTLPAGLVQGSYYTALAASGGTSPYTWALASGSVLPSGLSLDPAAGAISGVPLVSGPFTFTIQVTDSAGNSGSGTFHLSINPSPSGTPSRVGVCPHIAVAGSWSTTVTVVNTDIAPIVVKVNFWQDNGQAFSLPFTFPQNGGGSPVTATYVERSLPVGGSLVIATNGPATATSVETGWVEVLATGNAGAFAIFSQQVSSTLVAQGTAALDTHTQTLVTVPYDNTNGFVTGVALANSSASQSAVISATVLDENGVVLAPAQMLSSPLPANGHTSFAPSVEFPSSANHRGVIQIQSTSGQDITALAFSFSPYGSFTSVPVLYPAVSMSLDVH
jgi:hypothetical protein